MILILIKVIDAGCYISSSSNKFFLYIKVPIVSTIQPDMHTKPQKEGAELEQFWDLLGEKSKYSSKKVGRVAESDPHLFSCSFSTGYRNDHLSITLCNIICLF